jgi:serine/threonine protein kinase
MLSNDQPLGRAGFEAVGSLGLIDHSDDPLVLDEPSSAENPTRLSDLIDATLPRPSLDEILSWADQLLDGIHQLHTQPRPVIHGAISPASIRVDGKTITLIPSSDVPETDASVSFKPLEQMWESLDHVTQRVILNPLDEKAQTSLLKDPNPASDIYSVGATIYAVATGMVPADALDRTIASMEAKPDPLIHPSEISPSLPIEIGDAIVKAMSLRREDRPFSAVILRQVFRTATVKIQERLASEPAPEPVPVVPKQETSVVPQESADADHARELAYKILAEKSSVGQNDEILDLDVTASISTEQTESPVELSLPVIVDDEPVEVPPDIAQETVSVLESYTDITPSFLEASIDEEPSKSSSKGLAIGVAAAAVIVAAIVGFFVFSSKSPAPAAPSPTTASELPTEAPQPVAESPIQTQVEPGQPADLTLPATGSTEPGSHERNTRAGVTTAAQDKTKKVAKPAPAKKQVTVDDLINDN